ncbi:MAG: hypothetical protein B6244_11185 [Candidatus Cloacimonetes bacterium 4572_55]|nr:MAG: hypothetical protein B6244_11185 [Candidatus Cloacimonetes bacterium 4572_55]
MFDSFFSCYFPQESLFQKKFVNIWLSTGYANYKKKSVFLPLISTFLWVVYHERDMSGSFENSIFRFYYLINEQYQNQLKI